MKKLPNVPKGKHEEVFKDGGNKYAVTIEGDNIQCVVKYDGEFPSDDGGRKLLAYQLEKLIELVKKGARK